MTLAVPVSVLVASAGLAGGAVPAPDVSGTWTFAVKRTDNQTPPRRTDVTETFVLKQEGETLTGTHIVTSLEFPLSGSVKGEKLQFAWQGETASGKPMGGRYSGTIVSGSKLTGSVEYAGGWSGEWTATRK